jgi:hypothetical protein
MSQFPVVYFDFVFHQIIFYLFYNLNSKDYYKEQYMNESDANIHLHWF